MSTPEIGKVYLHAQQPGIYARVDSFESEHALFSLWNVDQPGWQGGAALPQEDFHTVYGETAYLESQVTSLPPSKRGFTERPPKGWPKVGEVYATTEWINPVYAQVLAVSSEGVRFRAWEVCYPGWQPETTMDHTTFQRVYRDGPYGLDKVISATRAELNESFHPDQDGPLYLKSEQYEVGLSTTHWNSLANAALSKSAPIVRSLKLDPDTGEMIALAALQGVRRLIETWAKEADEDRAEEQRQAADYSRMINAPMRPETARALGERLKSGNIARRQIHITPPHERWAAFWASLDPGENRIARQELANYVGLPDEEERDSTFGLRPSYRCFVGRHEGCEPDGAEQGCTCTCGHTKTETTRATD